MSELARMLRREQRRHFMMSLGLISAAVVAGTMVTNERGIFSTVIGGGPLSALERAFVAVSEEGDHLPQLFHRGSLASMGPGRDGRDGAFGDEPFDVLGAPADLRRRLMEALGGDDDPEAVAASQAKLPSILSQDITPDSVALSDTAQALAGTGDAAAPIVSSLTQPSNAAVTNSGPVLTTQTAANDQPGGDAAIGGGDPTGAVPEPAIWALMIGGLGFVGLFQRRIAAERRRMAFLRAE